MARMVVIYRTPQDVLTFDRHYFDVHVPLTKQLPGLRRYEVSRGEIASPVGDPDVHLVAVLEFDSIAAVREAFASPQGQAAAADRRLLAPGPDQVMSLVFDTLEP